MAAGWARGVFSTGVYDDVTQRLYVLISSLMFTKPVRPRVHVRACETPPPKHDSQWGGGSGSSFDLGFDIERRSCVPNKAEPIHFPIGDF